MALIVGCQSTPKISALTTKITSISIPINNDNPSPFFSIDTLVNSYTTVPLETIDQSLIGTINAIYAINDRIIIVDKYISKSIFIFSTKGKFLSKITATGSGPGEFTNIRCCRADYDGIQVFDGGLSKIVQYSLDGKFKSEYRLKHFYKTSFIKYGVNKYLFYNACEPTFDNVGYKLIAWDVEKNIQEKLFLGMDKKMAKCKTYIDEQQFANFKNEISFFELFNDTIYKFNHINLEISPQYIIDFNKSKLPVGFTNNHNINDKQKEINNNKYACFMGRYIEMEDYLFFKYSYKQNEQIVIWNKKNNLQIANTNAIGLDKIDISVPNWYQGFNENQIIIKYESYELIDWLKEKQKGKKDIFLNQMTKMAETLKPQDNPILLLLDFKLKK